MPELVHELVPEKTGEAKVVTLADGQVIDDRKKPKGKTKPKGAPRDGAKAKAQEKKAPELHECPVTGDMVKGYFRMGMDARLKSAFLKVSKGKAKLESLSPRQQQMYSLWNKGVSLRKAAKQTAE